MGTSPPCWGLMANTNTIISSNPVSVFMYVTSLTCDFGDFDEKMVVSLTRLNPIDLENASIFSFDVAYL